MTRSGSVPPERGIFCNRTLNLRSIKAIGYDMDYTLVHYHAERWEERAYDHAKQRVAEFGWPVAQLRFQPELMVRGLILDTELGNIVKVNRFGYVKRGLHGTRPMSFDDQRSVYARTVIDLSERRFVFLNTLFSLSEACLYGQLVDKLDGGQIGGAMGYAQLYELVRQALDESHLEGQLKEEIIRAPGDFVVPDPDTPATLLDQKLSGKRIMLITNSEWEYTQAMMSHTFDPFLEGSRTWRDLFDLVIVNARKPNFFSDANPAFEISEGSRLEPVRALQLGGTYYGGDAAMVEKALDVSGDEILYVGDHIWGDVAVSKAVLRWRTALVLRELEQEVKAEAAFAKSQKELEGLMAKKERLERHYYDTRLRLQRRRKRYGPTSRTPIRDLDVKLDALRQKIDALDGLISPLAKQASELSHAKWGLLMRAGNDKSHLARQIERSADIYMSRVSNMLYLT
ncbi:MAG: HAD-IG family 5'-nucleotidase, partial [Gemmatimonadales bacterium]